jgi:hypothetical protein
MKQIKYTCNPEVLIGVYEIFDWKNNKILGYIADSPQKIKLFKFLIDAYEYKLLLLSINGKYMYIPKTGYAYKNLNKYFKRKKNEN